MSQTTLSTEQVAQYQERGYLLVSGLIPESVAACAEEAMWRLLRIERHDPATWDRALSNYKSYEVPELVACYTSKFVAAAAQLGGDDATTYRPPSRAYVINVFPERKEWQWPKPHIDHAIKEHAHKTFPRAFRVAAMTYVSDVPSHGGATIVWPASHRRIEALARSNPAEYEYMWQLGRDIVKAEIGEPVEVIANRGDVLFYHYLCAHSGSMNVRDYPRFAMNMKW